MRNPITRPKLMFIKIFPVVLLLPWVTGAAVALDATAQEDVDNPGLTVLAGALNVRGGPGVSYPVVGLLMQGNQVPVIG